MKIFQQMTNLCRDFPNISVSLGTFDGVHLGHQKIIGRAVELARREAGTGVVFTFTNHPLSIIDRTRCPVRITTPDLKAKFIEALGVDVLLTIPFTEDFLRLSPEAFIALLTENLRPRHVIVGPNYSFGYKSAGTPEMLRKAGQEYGFDVEILDAVYVDNILASSTAIRHLILDGNISQAANLLGRPVQFTGCVVKGDGRGKTLGYPTANLEIADNLAIPSDGVYAVKIQAGDVWYNGVANIGRNPTFRVRERRIEVFILGFEGDLYGQQVVVSFIDRIRNEITFQSAEELKCQIYNDIERARTYYFQ